MPKERNDNSSSSGHVFALMVLVLAVCVSLLYSTRDVLLQLLRTNQFLQAFVAATLCSGLSISLVMIGQQLWTWVRASTFSSVTIHNKDEIFDKVIDYVGRNTEMLGGALMVQTRKRVKTFKDWRLEQSFGVREPPKVEYRPANDSNAHIFMHEGRSILLTRTKGETITTGYARTPTEIETLTLSTWKGGADVLKRIIAAAVAASFKEESDELSVYTLGNSWMGGWEKALSKRPRPLSSVILDEDLAVGLAADARAFLAASAWYGEVGIPYRRGYLLHGPPGCGKTSFCQALAGELKLDVCMLTLTNKLLDDNSLASHLRDAPSSSIVLLEDVDAVFHERAAQGDVTGVTFSGLLNALDGVASQEGRLFFMTTNYVDRLDAALIRPGRCDVKVELRDSSHAQQRALFGRFFAEAAPGSAERFAEQLPEYELSMAQLQGYLLEHKRDVDAALARVPELLRVARPLVVDRTTIYEHLRRVGLERWASTFEHHGVCLLTDLCNLGLDEVKKWSHALVVDSASARRMALLLSRDTELMRSYRLADLSTVKELFMQTFVHAPAADAALGGARLAPVAKAQADSHAVARRAAAYDDAALTQLAEALCVAVQREGKGASSVWQLSRHLRLYEHDPRLCVARAAVLVAERPAAREPPIDALPLFDWLRRAGHAHLLRAFEDAGYTRAQQVYDLGADKLKDEVKLEPAVVRVLAPLLSSSGSHPSQSQLVPPDCRRVRESFLAAHAGAAPADEALLGLAQRFADSLCDEAGCGLISKLQLDTYLVARAADGAEACAERARAELVDAVRPAAEPPAAAPVAEPSEWVYGWLKAAGLEALSEAFFEHKLTTREALLSEPPLEAAELKAIGITKSGDQRAILAMLRALRSGKGGGAWQPW